MVAHTMPDDGRFEDSATHTYKARRYALKFDPPCIFLEYEDQSSAKVRVRAVKLAAVQPGIDVDRLTRKVVQSFPRRLDAASVKYEQVKNLVHRLIDNASRVSEEHKHKIAASQRDSSRFVPSSENVALCGPPPGSPLDGTLVSTSLPPSPSAATRLSGGGGDVSSAAGAAAAAAGGQMRSVSDDGQRYSPANGSSSPADGADEEDMDAALDELDRELMGSSAAPPRSSAASWASPPTGKLLPPLPIPATAASAWCTTSQPFDGGAECLELEMSIADDLDLNHATVLELKMAKARMEEDFQKHRIWTDNEAFEWDKQVEFGPPQEANEWDD